jgi:phytochrome-interacting factor 4
MVQQPCRQLVMQSQKNWNLSPRLEKAAARRGWGQGGVATSSPIPTSVPQDDEAGLQFPFALVDSLDKDIFSELFCEAPRPASRRASSA